MASWLPLSLGLRGRESAGLLKPRADKESCLVTRGPHLTIRKLLKCQSLIVAEVHNDTRDQGRIVCHFVSGFFAIGFLLRRSGGGPKKPGPSNPLAVGYLGGEPTPPDSGLGNFDLLSTVPPFCRKKEPGLL